MMALHSFLPFLQESKGLSHQQILSFYLTAGCLSSLGSHLFSVMNKSRWMVGGLGASGAIYALVAACAYFHPESRIGIMFVPINFKMKELFPCIVAMDVIGLALKWRHLDHACHLSGALIGYLYAMYGISLWSQIQHDLFHYRKKL
jgi:rhomboid-like protein